MTTLQQKLSIKWAATRKFVKERKQIIMLSIRNHPVWGGREFVKEHKQIVTLAALVLV